MKARRSSTEQKRASGPRGSRSSLGAENRVHHRLQASPRDFLKEARGWLKFDEPLPTMLRRDRRELIQVLIHLLHKGAAFERKYAAFALGQIGEHSAIPELEKQLKDEAIATVQEALNAALAGLRESEAKPNLTEVQRRKIIEEVYEHR